MLNSILNRCNTLEKLSTSRCPWPWWSLSSCWVRRHGGNFGGHSRWTHVWNIFGYVFGEHVYICLWSWDMFFPPVPRPFLELGPSQAKRHWRHRLARGATLRCPTLVAVTHGWKPGLGENGVVNLGWFQKGSVWHPQGRQFSRYCEDIEFSCQQLLEHSRMLGAPAVWNTWWEAQINGLVLACHLGIQCKAHMINAYCI